MSAIELIGLVLAVIGAVSLFYWRLYTMINRNSDTNNARLKEHKTENQNANNRLERRMDRLDERFNELRHEVSEEYIKKVEFNAIMEGNRSELNRQFEFVRQDINGLHQKIDSMVQTIVKALGGNGKG